ncbi:hypothetical protein [Bernardetia sp. MNP-M8]|uniref:hypothetical protein n=1 Tax=Bernardetia sp. MNP-M8 TaxID=3127470 RepID=UPI0030D5720B
MLPQANSVSRISDLKENAFFIELGSDNVFNAGDYILWFLHFYFHIFKYFWFLV